MEQYPKYNPFILAIHYKKVKIGCYQPLPPNPKTTTSSNPKHPRKVTVT